MRPSRNCLTTLVLLAATTQWALGQSTSAEQPSDEAAIRAAIVAYVEAFNERDVERLVSLWSPEGVYISRSTGEAIVGREAMAEEFAAILTSENPPKLAVTTESIEFISPNVALERGVARVSYSPDDVVETRYRVVLLEEDGKWLIDRVSEDQMAGPNERHEKLKQLEWLLGDWVDEGDGFKVETSCKWTKNQNFMSRTYIVTVGDEIKSSGLQIIGWDAGKDQIVSWLFDSDGSVVTGTWLNSGDHWDVNSVASLADGSSGSYTSIFRPLNDGTCAWQKVNRVLDGELLPNLDEIVLTRK